MSYDLLLWREQPGTSVDVSSLLDLDEEAADVPGLVPLPLAEVERAFQAEFPDITVGGAELDWEGAGSYFQVGYTFSDERHASTISVMCGYELLKAPDVFERLHRVAEALRCRYLDLQQS